MPSGLLPRGTLFWLGGGVVALFLPFISGGSAFLSDCTLFAIWASINLMWSLVLGIAGIQSFATLAIAGAAAYAASFASVEFGFGWPLMFVVGTLVGAALGLIVALPAIRLRGIYFALLTFGLAQLFRSYTTVTESLGGAQGLYGTSGFVPLDLSGTTSGAYIGYYAGIALLAVALVVYWAIAGGRLGLLLKTARDSEPFGRALGIDVVRVRLAVFVVSSAILGMAGAFYASYYRGISPSIFDFSTLLLLFAMIVVGGMGSARGILLGTGLLLYITQAYLDAGAARFIVAGALMYLVTIATTEGLVGVPHQLRDWLESRRSRGERGGTSPGEGPPDGAVPARADAAASRT